MSTPGPGAPGWAARLAAATVVYGVTTGMFVALLGLAMWFGSSQPLRGVAYILIGAGGMAGAAVLQGTAVDTPGWRQVAFTGLLISLLPTGLFPEIMRDAREATVVRPALAVMRTELRKLADAQYRQILATGTPARRLDELRSYRHNAEVIPVITAATATGFQASVTHRNLPHRCSVSVLVATERSAFEIEPVCDDGS